ncbi:MAG: Holliday junction resolvase RuvX [Planctomycetales bacterium]|nr:Holliday junction resolvase RuvX [bacterium]UNM09974.1 MAG: Holliday junction resolvase RuvX [Planctomycetales bacterium]
MPDDVDSELLQLQDNTASRISAAHERDIFTTSSQAYSHSPKYANLSRSHMQTEESNLYQEMRIIGLDAGSVRTGISVADPSCTLASPYLIIHTNPISGFAKRLKESVKEFTVDKVIMGLPLDLRGREGESARLARELAAQIQAELGWSVEFQDERFSSDLAMSGPGPREGVRRRTGKSAKQKDIDAHAAAVILQSWLDYGRHRSRD